MRVDSAGIRPNQLSGFVPFAADRAENYRAAGFWAGRTLDSIIADQVAARPDHPAIVDATSRFTYAELDTAAARTAAGLAELGILPGDRVLLQLPNSCHFAIALFGLLRLGAIPVMCLPGHRSAEIGHFATASEATGLIIAGNAEYLKIAATVQEANPELRHVIVEGEPGKYASLAGLAEFDGAPIVREPLDTAAPALLQVSGGTTGLPKLIPRTHDDYLYTATASAQVCGFGANDVYLVALPAGHNFPLVSPGLLGALSVGATTVFTADASPEAAFEVIDRHGVTVTSLVPALAKVWAHATEWEPVVPTTLRLLQVGGAKLAADDAAHIRRTLTPGLQQVFGMAEGLINYTRIGDPADVVDRTQGRPLSVADELRVVDDTGSEVPDGTEGELLARGPYTINGYFNADAVNRHAFTPDGYYRTGDKVRRLPNGYLEVTGRIKDVILRGGETVSALDLEEHLLAHPAIWSAAAVALPDEALGERICAAVVFDGDQVTLPELRRFLDNRGVAVHARPDVLVPMTSLPTTTVGKVDKKAIVAALARR